MQRKLGFPLGFDQPSRANLKYSRGTNNAGRGFNARLGPPPSGKLFPNLAPTLPPRRGRRLLFLFKASCKTKLPVQAEAQMEKAYRNCLWSHSARAARRAEVLA